MGWAAFVLVLYAALTAGQDCSKPNANQTMFNQHDGKRSRLFDV
jgi:hypothetical protein